MPERETDDDDERPAAAVIPGAAGGAGHAGGNAGHGGAKGLGDPGVGGAKGLGDPGVGGAKGLGDPGVGGAKGLGDPGVGGAKGLGDPGVGGAKGLGDPGVGGAKGLGDPGVGGAKGLGDTGVGGRVWVTPVSGRSCRSPDRDLANPASRNLGSANQVSRQRESAGRASRNRGSTNLVSRNQPLRSRSRASSLRSVAIVAAIVAAIAAFLVLRPDPPRQTAEQQAPTAADNPTGWRDPRRRQRGRAAIPWHLQRARNSHLQRRYFHQRQRPDSSPPIAHSCDVTLSASGGSTTFHWNGGAWEHQTTGPICAGDTVTMTPTVVANGFVQELS